MYIYIVKKTKEEKTSETRNGAAGLASSLRSFSILIIEERPVGSGYSHHSALPPNILTEKKIYRQRKQKTPHALYSRHVLYIGSGHNVRYNRACGTPNAVLLRK
ncbi:hypothetical protein M0R45_018589 [Rubus argutus]|uniref:Uncharacterized protein n=1 Tax=Rubus argutus TaxID=59490 RepID=A0AAW1X2X7_RUBAR